MSRRRLVIRPDYDLFTTVSISVMEIFRRVTPAVEALSLDEAFLDVSGSAPAARRRRSAVAELIRARVADEQGITCSVGVAGTVGVAKIASRRAKPDGVVVVPPDQVTSFLHPLAVTELWGVGEKTGEQLHRLGLHTVGDLAHTPRPTLQRALGRAMGAAAAPLRLGRGQPDGDRPAPRRPRGRTRASASDETFGRDTDDPEVVLRELLRLTVRVAARLRAASAAARTVTLKVRFADFTTITRSRTRPEPTDVTGEIYETAAGLFRRPGAAAGPDPPGRGAGGGSAAARDQVFRQLVLGERDQGWSEADQAVDRAVSRFGAHRGPAGFAARTAAYRRPG